MAAKLYFGVLIIPSIVSEAIFLAVSYDPSGMKHDYLMLLAILIFGISFKFFFALLSIVVKLNTLDDISSRLFSEFEPKRCSFQEANWISKVMFGWVEHIIELSSKVKYLEIEDIDFLPVVDTVKHATQRFLRVWNSLDFSRSSMMLALIKAYGLEYFSLGALKFLVNALMFAGPVLLEQIVNFISTSDQSDNSGYLFVVALFICLTAGAFLQNQYDFMINRISFWIRSAVVTTVYRKSLSISLKEKSRFSTGEVANLISVDSRKIMDFCISFHEVWSLPVQIASKLNVT
jgi:hypothetical protein